MKGSGRNETKWSAKRFHKVCGYGNGERFSLSLKKSGEVKI
jgi:hypothetical protein